MTIEKFQQLSAGTSYSAKIRIHVRKAAGSSIGSRDLFREIPVALTTHITAGTTAQIDQCGGTSSGSGTGMRGVLAPLVGKSITCSYSQFGVTVFEGFAKVDAPGEMWMRYRRPGYDSGWVNDWKIHMTEFCVDGMGNANSLRISVEGSLVPGLRGSVQCGADVAMTCNAVWPDL